MTFLGELFSGRYTGPPAPPPPWWANEVVIISMLLLALIAGLVWLLTKVDDVMVWVIKWAWGLV